jgi:hypothetical protein
MITYIKVLNLVKITDEVKQNNVFEVDSEETLLWRNSFYENLGCLFQLDTSTRLFFRITDKPLSK